MPKRQFRNYSLNCKKEKTNCLCMCTWKQLVNMCRPVNINLLANEHHPFYFPVVPEYPTTTARFFHLVRKLQTCNILYFLYPVVESHSGVSLVLNQEAAGNCTALQVLMKIQLCICRKSLYFSELLRTSGNTTRYQLRSLSLSWFTAVSTSRYLWIDLLLWNEKTIMAGKAKTALNAHTNAATSYF